MASSEESSKKLWKKRGKFTFYTIIAAGIGFLIGLYLIAPMQAKSGAYVPKPVKEMPTDMVRFKNPDEGQVLLPLKIANTYDSREKGLNKVGAEALENTYLLYAQDDVTTWEEDYDVSKIKAALSFAVINGEGKVVAIKSAKPGDDSLPVEKDHRWVLAMKKGLLEEFGIKVGSKLAIDSLPNTE